MHKNSTYGATYIKIVKEADFIEMPSYGKFNFQDELIYFLERSNSEQTRRTYALILREFFKFNKLKLPQEIVAHDVLKWRKALHNENNKESSIKTKLAVIRSFFEYLKNKEFITVNPANKYLVPPPKVADSLSGRALEPKQIKYLLSFPKTDSITGARDYALMLLMLRTFMRVSEALSLRDNDFYSRKGVWYVNVKIKGGERKATPIPLEVKRAIDHYLLLDRDHRKLVHALEGEGKFIFMPSGEKKHDIKENKPITSHHAWFLVKYYGEQLFMPDILKMKKENPNMDIKLIKKQYRLTPHDFRRTAITRSLDLGETYRRVQNAARLKNIGTVRRYDQHREALEENSILTLNYDE